MVYTYTFGDHMEKFYNSSLMKKVAQIGNLNFNPLLSLIKDIRNEKLPEHILLSELYKRITYIKEVFSKAVETVYNDNILKLYMGLDAELGNFYNSVIAIVNTTNQGQPVQSNSLGYYLEKIAVVDPAKANAIIMNIDKIEAEANKIDSSISFLATEIRQLDASMKQTGQKLPMRSVSYSPLLPPPSMELQEVDQNISGEEMVGSEPFPKSFGDFLDNLLAMDPLRFEEYKKNIAYALSVASKTPDKPLGTSFTRFEESLSKIRRFIMGMGRQQGGKESTGKKNVYKYIIKYVSPYAEELETQPFEEVLLAHPKLLTDIGETLKKIEGAWGTGGNTAAAALNKKIQATEQFFDEIDTKIFREQNENQPIGVDYYNRFNQLTVSKKNKNQVNYSGITPESTFEDLRNEIYKHKIYLGAENVKRNPENAGALHGTKGGEEYNLQIPAKEIKLVPGIDKKPELNEFFIESNLDSKTKEFFDGYGIKTPEDIYSYRDKTAEFMEQIIVPQIESTPYDFQTVFKEKTLQTMSAQEKEAGLINNAAINYAIFQLHGNHTLITSLLRAAKEEENNAAKNGREVLPEFYINIQNQIKKILMMCFPKNLVESARAKMIQSDRLMLSHGAIKKTGPDGAPPKDAATPFLFDSMPEYSLAIDKATQYFLKYSESESLSGKPVGRSRLREIKKDIYRPGEGGRGFAPPYFSFAGGRAGLGYIVGPFYGGAYKRNSGVPNEYDSVVQANPQYANYKIMLSSLTDYNAPFWGTGKISNNGKSDFVNNMAVITNTVKRVVLSQQMPDDVKFYLAYMNTSENATLNGKIILNKPVDEFKQDLVKMMSNWKLEYDNLASGKTASSNYLYYYPLKSLFS